MTNSLKSEKKERTEHTNFMNLCLLAPLIIELFIYYFYSHFFEAKLIFLRLLEQSSGSVTNFIEI